MYPSRFSYARPSSVDETLAVLHELGEDARLLAGGASLIPRMKYRQVRPSVVVDIAGLDQLRGVRRDGEVSIGAMTRHAQAAGDRELGNELPIVRDVGSAIGDPQIRNMGTVGGGVAAAEATGDWGPALLALHGRVRAVSRYGERDIPANELFTGPESTSLHPDELLTEVLLPRAGVRTGSAHVKFMLRAVTALGACSVALALDDEERVEWAGVAFGGLTPWPVAAPRVAEAVLGKRVTDATAAEASRVVVSSLDTHSDARTSAAHRKHVGASLARKALRTAYARAARNGGRS